MTTTRWSAPDICGDLLAEAWRPDAAEPIAVHVRSALHALISRGTPGWAAAIRLVVDDGLPAAPGYEIHRAVPRGRPA